MTNSTLKKFLPLLLLPLLSFTVKAQTNVSGFISSNTTWDLAGSPYIVVANALVSQGVTLTINPGVVVKLDSACALQVDGEMIAIGTDASRITFTSNQLSPAAGDWAKLHFSGLSADAVFDSLGNYVSGCIMKYCDVLYAGGLDYGAIHIESSSPYITHCSVQFSMAAGIYCVGSTYLLDSSLISNNINYGLYFDQFSQFSCGLLINGDTIENNAGGGLYLGQSSGTCNTEVKNNYFISNSGGSTIFANYTLSNVSIKNNNFLNNSSPSGLSSTVNFDNESVAPYQNITITENYFNNNEGELGIVTFGTGGTQIIINENFFSNNISGGMISTSEDFTDDSIKCNTFLNNQTYDAVISLRSDGPYNSGIITNNIFDGNVNIDIFSNGVSVLSVGQSYGNELLDFSDNIVRNNSAVYGTCCYINAYLNDSTEQLQIHNNEFTNNTASNIIYLTGSLINNSSQNFLYMKYNNFNDPVAQYELYNDIPYGSPDIYPDSNYWGSTSTSHIDSVIFDYFDSANLSVVYYKPILTAPVVIDTTCSGFSFPTAIKIINEPISSTAFPNPFSNSTEVKFGNDLQDAEVDIYNVFGQRVRAIEHFSGNEISIDRGNLSSGIYIYEIVEKQAMVTNGKLVIE